jgi:hypothetical protein
MAQLYFPANEKVTVKVEGTRVLLIRNGTLLLDLTWEGAKGLARALRIQSARAEQASKIPELINDQATLIRAGVPIALTNDPRIFKEAGNEAAFNRELRKALPGGIPTGVTFGSPCVKGKPKKGTIGAQGIPSGEVFGKIGGR